MNTESIQLDVVADGTEMPIGKVKTLTYVSADGSYGDAVGLTVLDTTDWTDEDFAILDLVLDGERKDFAIIISDWIEEGRVKNEKYEKFFSSYDVALP